MVSSLILLNFVQDLNYVTILDFRLKRQRYG